jgi:Fe2+ or Zn2+ uptake regulation protein
MVKLGEGEIRLTPQQTALVLHLAQGSKPATARDLIEAGLFRSDAAHSTVHSALLTLRRRLDELEEGLGPNFVRASARGYNLVAVT